MGRLPDDPTGRAAGPQSEGTKGRRAVRRVKGQRLTRDRGLSNAGGFFDDAVFPAGQGWDEVEFPDGAYALEVTGESMMPLYRDGDIIIVSPNAPVRRGDRVQFGQTVTEMVR